jgi:hypothetical protein
VTSNLFMFCIAAELSPPPEPFESLADPEAKKEDEIRKMAKAIMDEAFSTVKRTYGSSFKRRIAAIVKMFGM